MSQHSVQSILVHFSQLFILCKVLGIYPYDFQVFHHYRELKKSTVGTCFVIVVMLIIIVLYNLLIFSFAEEDTTLKATQSTLTFVIGIFLTYIGLVMMVTDQLSAVRNQKYLGALYERIRTVDERLFREGCVLNNTSIRKRIGILIVLVLVCELTIMISTYAVLIDNSKWKSLLWMFSCFPTLYNSLDKIWFAIILQALEQRFAAINRVLNEIVEEHERYKLNYNESSNDGKKDNIIKEIIKGVQQENLNYLYTELSGAATAADVLKYKSAKNRVKPIAVVTNSFNNFNKFMPKKINQTKTNYESQLSNVCKVEDKLNNFCQLHDELCEIGKMLNELWSYSILVLMAYGFLIFTAQLYFLYCATQKQGIPSLFLSAKNAWITAVFLTYTAGKCIYLIFLSWKTSLESKRTGICLHKCGVVADDNDLYEIINHLSLKLLNHSVDFSACGFFSLDMETLYGVSGGITSYLIILIQFNLAAQQAQEALKSHNSNVTTESEPDDQFDNVTTLFSRISSTMSTITTELKIN